MVPTSDHRVIKLSTVNLIIKSALLPVINKCYGLLNVPNRSGVALNYYGGKIDPLRFT